MLKLNDQKIQVLHLEPTDACNAACPQCLRETDITFDKNDLHHLTVEQIKSIVDVDTIKNLNKMFMCGTYGDPAAGKHTLEIYRYFRSINPTITLGMNTNGGLRNTSWWQELADLLNQPRDYVVFSIDGLEDTNHIYRVNVKWTKVLENTQAFIRAGGIAHWEMLVFEHNQHQIDLAQQTAKDMGFKWFRAKVSKRFKTHPIEFLKPPVAWKDPNVNEGEIDCQAIKESSLYISAKGIIYPCCWLGPSENSIDKFDSIQKSWASTAPNNICVATCTKNVFGTSFTNQWQREVEFQFA
jgi:sulfatase maturation enzyme AslB (radical SAM superfamily)